MQNKKERTKQEIKEQRKNQLTSIFRIPPEKSTRIPQIVDQNIVILNFTSPSSIIITNFFLMYWHFATKCASFLDTTWKYVCV